MIIRIIPKNFGIDYVIPCLDLPYLAVENLSCISWHWSQVPVPRHKCMPRMFEKTLINQIPMGLQKIVQLGNQNLWSKPGEAGF